MDPSAPPPGWNSGEKMQPPPPSYQDYPQYPNPGQYPNAGQHPNPGQYPNAGAQGYVPPPYGAPGSPYGQYSPGHSPLGPQATVAVQPTTVYVTRGPLPNPVKDYLAYSIFTMVCCCLPIGIAALISSISTRDANNTGNLDAAQKSSRRARNLNHAAVGIGITIAIIWIVLSVLLEDYRKD